MKTLFYSVFSKAQLFKNKNCMLRNRNFMTNSGLFLNMEKWCFLGLFFSGFNVIVFLCLVKLQKCLNMLIFPSLGGFVGWLILVYLGLEGLVAFVFLVFAFLFGVGFVSVCLLCVVLWLDVVVPVSVFFVLFVCFFFLFLFFSVFKGQVRWPKGPPHLALSPPCFFVFVFCFVFLFDFLFCCFLFVFFWRV